MLSQNKYTFHFGAEQIQQQKTVEKIDSVPNLIIILATTSAAMQYAN